MTLTERVEFTTALLLQAAREADMVVSGDQRIAEGDLELAKVREAYRVKCPFLPAKR